MADGELAGCVRPRGAAGRPADLPSALPCAGGDAQQQAVLKPSWLVSPSPLVPPCSTLPAFQRPWECHPTRQHCIPDCRARRVSGRLPPPPPCRRRLLRRGPPAGQLARLLLTCQQPPSADLQDGGRPAGGTGAAGAAGPWRSAAHRGEQPKPAGASSRFDTSIGGRNWREDEREGAPRRDAGRWGEGEHAGAGRQFGEPHNPAWNDAPRGRGRGTGEVDSWKPRGEGDGWRAGGGDTQGSSSWRSNDRWGGGAAGALLCDWRRVGLRGTCHGASCRPHEGGSACLGNAQFTLVNWSHWSHCAFTGRGADTWRGGASRFGPTEPGLDGSRGFSMGRGRGRGTGGGHQGGGIGAAAGGGPTSSWFGAFGAGGGVGGRMRWGASHSARRYGTDSLSRLYKTMLYSGR